MIALLRIDRLCGQISDKSRIFGKSAKIHLISPPYAANTPRGPREWSPRMFYDKLIHYLRFPNENIDFLTKILRNL